jgi:hypothetical protein
MIMIKKIIFTFILAITQHLVSVFDFDWSNNKEPPVILPPSDQSQVLVLDANTDLRLDLFGSRNGTRTFWTNKGNGIDFNL